LIEKETKERLKMQEKEVMRVKMEEAEKMKLLA
jgi:hypothetical protein